MRQALRSGLIVDGKKRLLVGGKINRFIPNLTFDLVARRASSTSTSAATTLRARTCRRCSASSTDPSGVPQPRRQLRASTSRRSRRVSVPDLGVGMEESLRHDPEALLAFRAFNRWMDEDWGFATGPHLAAPYITLVDPAGGGGARAGARPRRARGGDALGAGRGPGAAAPPSATATTTPSGRAAEAGITVAFHSGDAGYLRYGADWGCGGEFESFRYDSCGSAFGEPDPRRDGGPRLRGV
jgi:hypothetical protein